MFESNLVSIIGELSGIIADIDMQSSLLFLNKQTKKSFIIAKGPKIQLKLTQK